MNPRNTRLPLAALALALALPLPAVAAESIPWEHIDSADGIDVYRHEVAGSPHVAFRGVAVVEAPLPRVLHVLGDNDHRTEWVDRLVRTVRLEDRTPWEFVIYQAYDLPAVMSDRDYVIHAIAWREADDSVTVELHSVEHPAAPPTVGVRAWLSTSTYRLTPLDGGARTRVDVEIQTDPRGWVPAWLVNRIQKSWPHKTLAGIRRQVTKPHVKDARLPPRRDTAPRIAEPKPAAPPQHAPAAPAIP